MELDISTMPKRRQELRQEQDQQCNREQAQEQERHHPTLSSYYTHLITLETYIQRLRLYTCYQTSTSVSTPTPASTSVSASLCHSFEPSSSRSGFNLSTPKVEDDQVEDGDEEYKTLLKSHLVAWNDQDHDHDHGEHGELGEHEHDRDHESTRARAKVREKAKALLGSSPLVLGWGEVTRSHQEALDQVIQNIFALHAMSLNANTNANAKTKTKITNHKDLNVLVKGYKRSGPSGPSELPPNLFHSGLGLVDMNNTYINSQLALISKSPSWITLHSRIGTDLFIWLLSSSSKVSIFQGLENNCYSQLTGRPMDVLPNLDLKEKDGRRRKKRGGEKMLGEGVGGRGRRCKRRKVGGGAGGGGAGGGFGGGLLAEEAGIPTMGIDIDIHIENQGGNENENEQEKGNGSGKLKEVGVKVSRNEFDVLKRPLTLTLTPTRPPTEIKILRNMIFYHRRLPRTSTLTVHSAPASTSTSGFPMTHIFNNLESPPPRSNYTPTSPSSLRPEPPTSFSIPFDDSTPTTKLSALAPLANANPDKHYEPRTLLRYIFPRAHGLSNVFTPPPKNEFDFNARYNRNKGFCQNFKTRNEEIEGEMLGRVKGKKGARTPERFKGIGKAMEMMEEIILRHRKMLTRSDFGHSYRRLRAIYCPCKTRSRGQGSKKALAALELNWMDAHTDYRSVERYILAVTHFLLPSSFWGSHHNEQIVIKHVKTFVRYRRFETFSLHQAMQGIRVDDFKWLAAGNGDAGTGQKRVRVTQAEAKKRRELVEEVLFWLFDGLIIPMIQQTFYVTETAVSRYRTFYFRHEDWEALCKPMLDRLRRTTFKKLAPGRQNVLKRERPATTVLRMLPKGNNGLRPIANLGKPIKKIDGNGNVYYEKSINQTLEDAFHALTAEKAHHPDILSSTLFGLYDIYGQLKTYKMGLLAKHGHLPKLYFAKLDIQSAFDTISQRKLIQVLETVLRRDNAGYITSKYTQMLPITGRSSKLWKKMAISTGDPNNDFPSLAKNFSQKRFNAVFVDQVEQKEKDRKSIMASLKLHVRQNLVRLDDGYYAQRTGIPQGSRVSSLLCSYFYGHMEKMRLGINRTTETTLLRIIDDFLYISTSQGDVERFVSRMLQGVPDYGCTISPSKSLVNFDYVGPEGQGVPKADVEFPYCGLTIDTRNLDLNIDHHRSLALYQPDTLTVKTTNAPGSGFLAWLKRTLENHNHIVFNDTALNSYETVCSNICTNFIMAAMKTFGYLSKVGVDLDRHALFVTDAIEQAIKHTYNAHRAHLDSQIGQKYAARCAVSRSAFTWMARDAFIAIFKQRSPTSDVLVMHLQERMMKMEVESVAASKDGPKDRIAEETYRTLRATAMACKERLRDVRF